MANAALSYWISESKAKSYSFRIVHLNRVLEICCKHLTYIITSRSFGAAYHRPFDFLFLGHNLLLRLSVDNVMNRQFSCYGSFFYRNSKLAPTFIASPRPSKASFSG